MGKFKVKITVSSCQLDSKLYELKFAYSLDDGRFFLQPNENSDLTILATATYFSDLVTSQLNLEEGRRNFFVWDNRKILIEMLNLSEDSVHEIISRIQWIGLNSKYIRTNIEFAGTIPAAH